MNGSNITDEFFDSQCRLDDLIMIEFKIIFVGIFGCIVALISIVHNGILFYTFNSSKVLYRQRTSFRLEPSARSRVPRKVLSLYLQLLRRRNLTYLMWISLCDISASILYIACMCVQVYFDFFQSVTLNYLWHHYIVLAFTISNITFSFSSFLLMAATIERYLQSTGNARSTALFYFLSNHRSLVVLLCFFFGVLFRFSTYYEVSVIYHPECTGLASYSLSAEQLFDNVQIDMLWKFWIRKFACVFLPFFVLAYFNAAIVMNVRRTDRDQTVKTLILYVTVGSKGEVTRLRSRLRTVTRMLVMVVMTYLVSQCIDVVIGALENFSGALLAEYYHMYNVATDVSSFLIILACALRLPIYTVNDKEIRMEVLATISMISRYICSFVPFGSPSWKRGKFNRPHAEIETTYYMPKRISIADAGRGRGMTGLIMARAQLVAQRKLSSEGSTNSICLV